MKCGRHFHNSSMYHVPDSLHYICKQCIDKKEGKIRNEKNALNSLCDVCEKRKIVYHVSDVNWSDYYSDNVGNKKWMRLLDE